MPSTAIQGANHATYVAWDPGISTGVAKFDSKGDLVGWGTCRGIEDLDAELWVLSLQDPAPEVFIIENYRVFRHKVAQHIGRSVETERVIGTILATARRLKVKIEMQEPGIKKIAELWSGIKYKGSHANSHHWDAINHGIYYLVKQGIRKARVFEDNIHEAAASELKKESDPSKKGSESG